MKAKQFNEELQNKTTDELTALLTEERETLKETNIKIRAGQESNVRKARQHRVRIAKILTRLNSLRQTMQEG